MSGLTPGNRNSTPEVTSSSLRPPNSRTIGAGHHLRASADFSPSPMAGRGPLRPSSEVYQGQNHNDEGTMDKATQQWIADIDQYEATLEEMAAATLDQDFKDELSAIEQWFRVLSEAERTAALYALLQQTTQVQIRFFIQVLQQMAKSHPFSGVLSPANFGEKDPMSQRFSDAFTKLSVDGSRNSVGARPPPSPSVKRNSGLDPNTIYSMFPDAAAAIAKQKAEFTQQTGMQPTSNRNSTVDRTSLIAPTISGPEEGRKENPNQPPSSPWGPRSSNAARPKSSSSHHPPMGQFIQPPPSAGLRANRPAPINSDSNIQSTTLNAIDPSGLPLLSPYSGSGNWASMVNTPMAPNFPAAQSSSQADMIANATAMKLAALSTVNNRIQLDDVRKYRRTRSTEGNGPGGASSNPQSHPNANFVMTNELGQVLSPAQAAALQAQQLAALNGRRSRPNSPGLAMGGGGPSGPPGMSFAPPQNNGYLTTYDASGNVNLVPQLNLASFGLSAPGQLHEGYLSDHSEIARGRSPRGRRGSSKPPEDPTDTKLLEDIPAWLRSLRLHKYTDNLKDLSWPDMIELDDEGLEKRGVNALGARRKMLKVFEQIKEAKADGKL
ncbi:SAM domain-containing protein [Eremomyces bilateralis CBS 781.70]|uniref:RNA-binding protein VTS1 n=1 Tax=Eremomyces bilateralis CBS 781.70 TaxID=1392243 RepID=A0A6G1FRY8_9PEZI|nr:SAM domain-containing protein [Eremomyces bilateralis CBS 781.70]KAF1808480.1 SAM domain-containing protein [Eremomyces bilateralis CBS 781.70]